MGTLSPHQVSSGFHTFASSDQNHVQPAAPLRDSTYLHVGSLNHTQLTKGDFVNTVNGSMRYGPSVLAKHFLFNCMTLLLGRAYQLIESWLGFSCVCWFQHDWYCARCIRSLRVELTEPDAEGVNNRSQLRLRPRRQVARESGIGIYRPNWVIF